MLQIPRLRTRDDKASGMAQVGVASGKGETAGPSTTLRSGRDDNSVAGVGQCSVASVPALAELSSRPKWRDLLFLSRPMRRSSSSENLIWTSLKRTGQKRLDLIPELYRAPEPHMHLAPYSLIRSRATLIRMKIQAFDLAVGRQDDMPLRGTVFEVDCVDVRPVLCNAFEDHRLHRAEVGE